MLSSIVSHHHDSAQRHSVFASEETRDLLESKMRWRPTPRGRCSGAHSGDKPTGTHADLSPRKVTRIGG